MESNSTQGFPTRQRAEEMLAEAEQMNPGVWIDHCRSAGANAEQIAKRCPGLDPDTAYVAGLLHDIGRRARFGNILHIFDGYDYLMAEGYPAAARICLTHSFPIKDAGTFMGKYDCSDERLAFLADFLAATEYDDYDRLIQLCDAISMPQGAVLMEKRFIDVAMRHGTPEFIRRKWQAWMDLKSYFDEKVGGSIYSLLPGIVENSFG